jgi:hypothetical protein
LGVVGFRATDGFCKSHSGSLLRFVDTNVMTLTVSGLILIAFGTIYLRRPTIYRRGLWLKTSVAIRLLSEAGYKRYMKGLGILFITLGVCLIVWEQGLAQLFG